MKYILFLFLFCACSLQRNEHALAPVSTGVSDTLTFQVPDSLTSFDQVKAVVSAKKFKNRGTIIIQAGTGNIANHTSKNKATQAIAGKEAKNTVVTKTKESAVATDAATAQNTVTKPSNSLLYIILLIVVVLMYVSYKTK